MQRRHLLTALASLPLWPLAARANPHAHHGMPAPASTPAAPAPVARQPLSGGAPLREPARLANQSGTAGRFAGTLTLAETRHALLPGEPTRLWTYNGSVPGPVIELTAGDQVSLTLRN
ncbi:multicopper oxidase domain-containing protein, partial [Laribacter hongkongensis]